MKIYHTYGRTTTVARIPSGWVVTHSLLLSNDGGKSVHSVVVPDPDHDTDPSHFRMHHEQEEIDDRRYR